MQQSHVNRTMIMGLPYDVSMFVSAGVSILCCILFYTFEVPSHLKMCSCTRLVHKFPKIHKDHTATVHLHMASVRKPQGHRAISVQFLCTAAETAR